MMDEGELREQALFDQRNSETAALRKRISDLEGQVRLLSGEVPPPREGSTWMRTFTGRRIYPLNPVPEEICVQDLAHHLSLECRYSGGIRWHYSVAQHSVLVARVVRRTHPTLALQALLHDAAEAFLKDLPRPIKKSPMFAGYKRAEARMHACICEALGVPVEQPAIIKAADLAVLNAERAALQAVDLVPVDDTWDEREKVPAADVAILRVEPEQAEFEFLTRYDEYGGRRR